MPVWQDTLSSKFEDAENGRYTHEQRWLKHSKTLEVFMILQRQYRDSERSQVFIKITKTKGFSAYGQIIDILFRIKKFPITIEPTPVPEGIAEFAHKKTPLDDVVQDPYGFEGDGREVLPATSKQHPNVIRWSF